MIIALMGRKQSGKSTAARFLVDRGFREYAFAHPMKEALKIIFGWTDAHVYGELKEAIDPFWGISPRQALQNIGTEWGQHGLSIAFPEFADTTGRQLWVKRFAMVHDQTHEWVISDLRFEHEYEGLREIDDVLLVEIIRPGASHDDRHSSEAMTGLGPDRQIINNGSLVDLRRAVWKLID